jgi:type IX secretion system PorP/SprF family membrane protein
MFRRALILVILCAVLEPVVAQDIVNFTQFFFNPYSINPSYAGIDGKPAVTLSYRKQWANIDGGPTIANLSFHTPATKHLSFGFNVLQDTRGILSNTGLLLTLGYNVSFSEHSFLRFGISAGAAFNKIDMEKLDGFTDNAIGKILNNNSYLLGNAGLSFHHKSFHGGFSFPLLLKPAYVSQDAFSVTEVKPFQAFVVHVSNRFYFNKNKNVFEPYLLYRINQGLPPQLEFASVLHLNHVVYIGASYKQDFGISALGGLKINKVFALGASYSIKNTGSNELNSPSYEIHLGLLLGKRKKDPLSYSFVDTEKEKEKKKHNKSTSELLAEKHKEEELEKKKKEQELLLAQKHKEEEHRKEEAGVVKHQEEEQHKKQEMARLEQEKLKTQVKPNAQDQQKVEKQEKPLDLGHTTLKTDSVVLTHKPRFNHLDVTTEIVDVVNTEHTPGDEQERISRLTLHAENPKEEHNETNHPNAERHEIVKQGSHPKELRVADYVISGVFKEEQHAKHFSDGLRKLGFKGGFGHLTEKAVWYVYVFQTDDINKARTERDKVRKTKLLRDSWLLTVQQ